MAEVLLVMLAGGVGAVARSLLDEWLTPRLARPGRGIVVVNLLGSLALGLVVGWGRAGALPAPWPAVLGVGFCGGFTTFSTAAVDAARRLRERGARAMLLHWGTTACGCVLMAVFGLAIAR